MDENELGEKSKDSNWCLDNVYNLFKTYGPNSNPNTSKVLTPPKEESKTESRRLYLNQPNRGDTRKRTMNYIRTSCEIIKPFFFKTIDGSKYPDKNLYVALANVFITAAEIMKCKIYNNDKPPTLLCQYNWFNNSRRSRKYGVYNTISEAGSIPYTIHKSCIRLVIKTHRSSKPGLYMSKKIHDCCKGICNPQNHAVVWKAKGLSSSGKYLNPEEYNKDLEELIKSVYVCDCGIVHQCSTGKCFNMVAHSECQKVTHNKCPISGRTTDVTCNFDSKMNFTYYEINVNQSNYKTSMGMFNNNYSFVELSEYLKNIVLKIRKKSCVVSSLRLVKKSYKPRKKRKSHTIFRLQRDGKRKKKASNNHNVYARSSSNYRRFHKGGNGRVRGKLSPEKRLTANKDFNDMHESVVQYLSTDRGTTIKKKNPSVQPTTITSPTVQLHVTTNGGELKSSSKPIPQQLNHSIGSSSTVKDDSDMILFTDNEGANKVSEMMQMLVRDKRTLTKTNKARKLLVYFDLLKVKVENDMMSDIKSPYDTDWMASKLCSYIISRKGKELSTDTVKYTKHLIYLTGGKGKPTKISKMVERCVDISKSLCPGPKRFKILTAIYHQTLNNRLSKVLKKVRSWGQAGAPFDTARIRQMLMIPDRYFTQLQYNQLPEKILMDIVETVLFVYKNLCLKSIFVTRMDSPAINATNLIMAVIYMMQTGYCRYIRRHPIMALPGYVMFPNDVNKMDLWRRPPTMGEGFLRCVAIIENLFDFI